MTVFHKLIILCLVLLPVSVQGAPKPDLWDFWNTSDETSQIRLKHEGWQQFLNIHVHENKDRINRVDYSGAAPTTGRDVLAAYLNDAISIDPRTLTKQEQFSYWVNLYNALTIRVVLDYPKKKSILRMGEKFLAIGPWDDVVANIAGQDVTLNDIEHRILRPIWQDHRIHFAVNCASIGCPNLSKIAYLPENAEQQLHDSESAYLNHDRGANVLKSNKIQLSSIFKWYGDDFGKNEKEIVAYIARHNKAIAKLDHSKKIRVDYEYDWALNALEPR